MILIKLLSIFVDNNEINKEYVSAIPKRNRNGV